VLESPTIWQDIGVASALYNFLFSYFGVSLSSVGPVAFMPGK
jgi:hypothetical protein